MLESLRSASCLGPENLTAEGCLPSRYGPSVRKVAISYALPYRRTWTTPKLAPIATAFGKMRSTSSGSALVAMSISLGFLRMTKSRPEPPAKNASCPWRRSFSRILRAAFCIAVPVKENSGYHAASPGPQANRLRIRTLVCLRSSAVGAAEQLETLGSEDRQRTQPKLRELSDVYSGTLRLRRASPAFPDTCSSRLREISSGRGCGTCRSSSY